MNQNLHIKRRLLHFPAWPLLLLLIGTAVYGKDAARSGVTERQPLFESADPLQLRIKAPIERLIRQKEEDPEWIPGWLFLPDASGTERTFDIQLKARGNSRRMSDWCDFPPYWINLKKSQVPGTLLENQNKLKVVVLCQETKASYRKYLVREYLAYKTYNLLSDSSFRVRLANIQYDESDGRRKSATRPAFIIEHDSRLADRLGGKIFEGQVVLPEFYDTTALTRVELFQFLLGNTDQSLFAGPDECCHNAKALIMGKGPGGIIPIPYDFDLSGLVNAPYAEPHEFLGIKSVTDRIYRGLRCPPGVMEATVRLFREKREAILALWRNTDLLEERDRSESVAYLEAFFAIIGDPASVQKYITNMMRDPADVTNALKQKFPEAAKGNP